MPSQRVPKTLSIDERLLQRIQEHIDREPLDHLTVSDVVNRAIAHYLGWTGESAGEEIREGIRARLVEPGPARSEDAS